MRGKNDRFLASVFCVACEAAMTSGMPMAHGIRFPAASCPSVDERRFDGSADPSPSYALEPSCDQRS
jgi:hypothetical protein